MAKSKAMEVPDTAVFPSQPPVDAERSRPPSGALVHDLMISPSKAVIPSVEGHLQQSRSVTVPSITLTVAGTPPTGHPATPEAAAAASALAARAVDAVSAPAATRAVVRPVASPASTSMLAQETTRATPPSPFVRYPLQSGLQSAGTDVDRSWNMEAQELQRFLSAVKRCIHRKSSTSSSSVATSFVPATGAVAHEAVKPERPLDRQAQQFLAVLEQDVAAVSNAAYLAEVNVQKYLAERGGSSPRQSRYRGKSPSTLSLQSDEKGSSQDSAYQELLCQERLGHERRRDNGSNEKNDDAGDAAKSPDAMAAEHQRMLLSTAREAAIFRETARIIRRKARELCERRITSAP
jgi:hypothetical protein